MPDIKQRRSENVNGDFYVDSTCIDCDTCRAMMPEVFDRVGEQSAVYHQPVNEIERIKALQTLLSCPTYSIGTVAKPKDVKEVHQTFPLLVEDNVYHCGFHSEKSYGAASYLIVRSEGNILVDSPRFVAPLVKQIEKLGGIRYLYLTHKDDVADHQKFREHFGCDRVFHRDDLGKRINKVEIELSGEEPYNLDADLLIIPVPGHTKGHTVLLYKNQYLFSGDHLAWSVTLNHLSAFRSVCWYSWSEQIKSMEKLANYSFEWVLPGHGRRYHGDREMTKDQMQKCIRWMETV
jgi:glyoxylase-like metal-dependent hydrolase (beta-lactamase superfamily II)/ferredoxin